MWEFLGQLFDTSGFPPRWSCGQWTAVEGWLHILSDLGVWSAYVAIPCVLGYFLLRRQDLPFRGIFWLFVAFILACGTTHLMDALMFWWPAYRLAGVIKLSTAAVSWATVVALIPITPRVLAMRSPAALEREVQARQSAEDALQRTNAELERRIQERTAELTYANTTLEQRVAERTAAAEERAQEVQASLQEKQVLLQEIHHRVKNNLQVISSLLDLQSHYTRDPATIEMFRESQNRVRSMALVHERLYQSETLSKIDFDEYLQNLVAHLSTTYGVRNGTIRFELDLEPVRLSIEAAVPCGLVVNELVSNCLKYAFLDKPGGVVHIRLAQVGQEVLLGVKDDGIGLPEEVTLRNAKTFGLRLVSALVDQLHGMARIDRRAGTTVEILFPASRKKAGQGGKRP